MALIERDGSWRHRGGSMVSTDKDGNAPCCCGPASCWIIVTPCDCECPVLMAFLLSPALDAVWSADDRIEGKVVRTKEDGCWAFLGSTRRPPPGTGLFNVSQIVEVLDGCDPICDDVPCPPHVGFSFTIRSCAGDIRTSCLERIRYSYRMSGYSWGIEEFSQGASISEKAFVASGSYEYVRASGNGFRDGDWSYNGRYVGKRVDMGNLIREWDYSQSVDQDTPGPSAGNREPNFAGPYGVSAPWRPQTGALTSDNTVNFDLFPDFPSTVDCNGRVDFTGDPTQFPVGFTENTSTTSAGSVRSSSHGRVQWPGENNESVAMTISISISEIELVDGTVIELEGCDEPQPSIARACDKKADVQQITYDAQFIPAWARTIRDLDTGQIFFPTSEPSEDDPVPYVPLPDPCEDEPPAGDIYRIKRCRSNGYYDYAWVGQGPFDPPIRKTVGYMPGEGLQPGEGHIYIGVIGIGGCLFAVPAQPSDDVYDGIPELILTSRPGDCRGRPMASIDLRPHCQDIIVDPPPRPRPTNESPDGPPDDDAGLGDLLKRAIDWATLNKLDGCAGCDRRRRLVNRWGGRVGRLAANLLGY